MVEQVVDRHHVGTWHGLRLPEQVRHVQQVNLVVAQNAVELEIALQRELVGMRRDRDEVGRQRFHVAQLAGNAEEEVFGTVIEPREGANGIAGVGPHAKLVDPPDVDGNAHNLV